MKPTLRVLVVILVLLILLVGLLVWNGLRNGNFVWKLDSDSPSTGEFATTTTDSALTSELATPAPSILTQTSLRTRPRAEGGEAIRAILANAEIGNNEAAVALMELALDQDVPAALREEALEHAFNLLPDELYRQQVMRLVKSGLATTDQLETIMFDLHGRDGRVQLETALEMAQTQTSPIAEDALELVRFLVGPDEDFGSDWAKWRIAVQAHLEDTVD